MGTPDRRADYTGVDILTDDPLPAPPTDRDEVRFELSGLADLRELVAKRAEALGFDRDRAEDLVLAVHELAANSVRHGGGSGLFRMWPEDSSLVCEVSDRGWITDPLVGRRRPTVDQSGGRGLWLVRQLCDVVELRSSEQGTVIRVWMSGYP